MAQVVECLLHTKKKKTKEKKSQVWWITSVIPATPEGGNMRITV
jgi:hypothetical protein